MKLYISKIVADLKSLAETNPLKVVLVDSGKHLSAEALFFKSKTLATNLLNNNFDQNDVCVIAIEPGQDFVVLMYALLMLNATIAIIDPEMGKQNYEAKLEQLKPKWMFIDSRLLFLDNFPLLKGILSVFKKEIPAISVKTNAIKIIVGKKMPFQKKHKRFDEILNENISIPELVNNEKTGRIIVYTSGTLSVPKGVVHTNSSMGTSINLLAKIIAGDTNDVVGTYLPHFMLLGIAAGLKVKTMNNKLNAVKKLQWLLKEKISIFFGPPSELLPLVIHCEKNNTTFPVSLKHLLIGSAPVHQVFLNRLINVIPEHTRITCTYGMTEHLLVAIADGRAKAKYSGEGDLLGKILSEVEVKITEDHEILVHSPQLLEKYYHEQTRPYWHATGDIGSITPDGELILLGRIKEMIIRRDFNIYPALYEGTIKLIPGINEAALVGVYKEELQDEQVYLALESELASIDHVSKLLRSGNYSIDKEALPDTIFKMTIPRKGRQDKIDRKAIVDHIQHLHL